MSTMSYNPHASSSLQQNPSSDWILHNSAVEMQAQHQNINQQHQQLFLLDPSFGLNLESSSFSDITNTFIPTTQYTATVLGDSARSCHKQPISPMILRASEREWFERKNLGYSDGSVSMSTISEESSVLDGLYQGFDAQEGIVPSRDCPFEELRIPPPFFEDGIEDIPFLGTNSSSPSNQSEAVGSCSSVSLDQFSCDFIREEECPSEFKAILAGHPEPQLAQEDLVQILVKCAESCSAGNYELLQSLLAKLQGFSSPIGDPLQRISFYASEALKEYSLKQGIHEEDHEKSNMEHDLAHQALYKRFPYHKLIHFTSNQAILEAVGNASHIHIIDLEIRQGLQWPSFIQSLTLRTKGPPKLLTITAIGNDEKRLNQTGRRLLEFAKSLGIEFMFHPLITEMEELDESAFNIEAYETLAVNCSVVLNKMLCKSGKIHRLLAVLRRLNPVILTVMEIESNQNMPSLVARFLQCLIFFRAVFHSIEASLERNNPDRVLIERVCIASNISSVLVDDKENSLRYACIDSWRKFLRHSGFKDSPLSHYNQCQANLLLGLYSNDSFKLHQDGFSITLAWQDTPIVSVSAWT